MLSPLRLVFFGTAELACPILRSLVRQSFLNVAAVVTQPDRPAGRDLKLQPSPVKQQALLLDLPVLQPERARNPAFVDELVRLRPDLIVVAAYGQILPPAILDVPPCRTLNVHTSLLPKYRGAAPIQWALLDDQPETGVTIMLVDAGLDTGPILVQESTPIHPQDNAKTLHDRLAQLGAELLVRTIPEYIAGKIAPQPQPSEGASYARKIVKEDGALDWSLPARVLWNRVRALVPWPGAFTHLPVKKLSLLKIWQAAVEPEAGSPGEVLAADRSGILVACGQEALRLQEVQREGGRRMRAAEFLAGYPLPAGHKLATAASVG